LDLTECIAKRSGVMIAQVWGSGHNQSSHSGDQLSGLIEVALAAIGSQTTLNRSNTEKVNRVSADDLNGRQV
jgi:hypothetical protein